MSNRISKSKTNGHAGPQGRVNGHGPASTEGGGISMPRDPAASDDTRRASTAMGASDTDASGTDCAGCAEVAPPLLPGALLEIGAGKSRAAGRTVAADNPQTGNRNEDVPGGDSPLPLQPSEFVEEVHRRADLIISWVNLVNSGDEKVKQRAIEKLTEMRYKGAAALADEPPQIIWDLPRPQRD